MLPLAHAATWRLAASPQKTGSSLLGVRQRQRHWRASSSNSGRRQQKKSQRSLSGCPATSRRQQQLPSGRARRGGRQRGSQLARPSQLAGRLHCRPARAAQPHMQRSGSSESSRGSSPRSSGRRKVTLLHQARAGQGQTAARRPGLRLRRERGATRRILWWLLASVTWHARSSVPAEMAASRPCCISCSPCVKVVVCALPPRTQPPRALRGCPCTRLSEPHCCGTCRSTASMAASGQVWLIWWACLSGWGVGQAVKAVQAAVGTCLGPLAWR